MVSGQTWAAFVFILLMTVFLYLHRSKIQVQRIIGPLLYFVMMRTTWGLGFMDFIGRKLRKPVQWFGYVCVVLGFVGMVFITYQLVKSTLLLFITPEVAPGIQPVLPFEAKGVFFVPFVYWIVSIFVIAVVHEFAHGMLARAHNTTVKSSGFAFLGVLVPVIPAAFVEPDEKQLAKKSPWQQLSVFAAGPGANVFMALLMVLAFGIDASPILPYSVTERTAVVDITELGTSLITFSGLLINTVEPDSPAARAGLQSGQTITALNGIGVSEREQTLKTVTSLKPADTLALTVAGKEVVVALGTHPDDATRGYLGIGFKSQTKPAPEAVARYGAWGVQALLFMISLIIWIFVLSIGIGLFNLVPLGPIDGGRMLKLVFERFTGSTESGTRLWKGVSMAVLGMVIINLVVGFLR